MIGSIATREDRDYEPTSSTEGARFECPDCGNVYLVIGHVSYGCADHVPVICQPCNLEIGTIREDWGAAKWVGGPAPRRDPERERQQAYYIMRDLPIPPHLQTPEVRKIT